MDTATCRGLPSGWRVWRHGPKIPCVRNPDVHTPVRSVRIDQDVWDDLEGKVGKGRRATIINELLRWYLRKPGAKLPQRPD